MNRIKILNNTTSPNFIGAWMIEDKLICDEMVSFFESNPGQQNIGVIGGGVDQTKKKSTDIAIRPKQLDEDQYKIFKIYISNLISCFGDYKEQWPFLKTINGLEIGTFVVQKYSPGGHFGQLHSERYSTDTQHRMLAFMTYLNDVEEGGETSFPYYGLRVKPEKGKTLIWPAEWTHAHTGELVKNGSKYIVTGWIQFS